MNKDFVSVDVFAPGDTIYLTGTLAWFADKVVCDECRTRISLPDYHCSHVFGCSDYDRCPDCYDTAGPHAPGHVLVPKAHVPKPRTYLRSRSLYETLALALANYSSDPLFGQRPSQDAEYSWISYEAFYDRAHDLGSGLAHLTREKPDPFHAGIMASNSIGWLLAEFAATSRAWVTVPLHVSYTDAQLSHIMATVPLGLVFCEANEAERLIRLLKAAGATSALVVVLTPAFVFARTAVHDGTLPELPPTPASLPASGGGFAVIPAERIEAMGHDKPAAPRISHPSVLETIVFTSGSTGMPKGVTVTEANAHAEVDMYCEVFSLARPYVVVEVAPFAWMTGRDDARITMLYGGAMAIYSRPMSRLLEDLQEISPSNVKCMPAIWARIYASYKTVVASLRASGSSTAEAEKAARAAFNPVLGSRVQTIVTGGAHTALAVKKFLKETWPNAMFYDAYGTSEAGGIAVNGVVNSGVEVRLVDVPEMGYLTSDNPPRGEIYVRTRIMTDGYYNDPENTAKRLKDGGWFATGDIGVMDSPSTLEVIDRRSAIFKLATGEFIVPSMIEDVLHGAPLVTHIYVHGDMTRSALVAVVVPDLDALVALVGEDSGIDWNEQRAAVALPHDAPVRPLPATVHMLVLRSLRTFAASAGLSSSNIPQAVYIDVRPFTPKAGLLTASMKICRSGLSSHYAGVIEEMYARLNASEQLATPKAADVAVATPGTGSHSGQAFPSSDDGEGASGGGSKATLDALRNIIGNYVGSASADTAGASLVEMGVSSTDTIRVLAAVQKQLAAQLPVDLVYEGLTIEEMADYIDSAGPSGAPATPTAGAIAKRSQSRQLYDDDFIRLVRQGKTALAPVADLPELEPQTTSGETVFVTGATGFLGRYIVEDLLSKHTAARVVILVRARSAEHAEERMREAAIAANLAHLLAAIGTDRLELVVGDLGMPMFGASPEQYVRLAGEVTRVIHAGARVSWVVPYSQLRQANVVGTVEIARFCMTVRHKPLLYVSTLSASASLREELAPAQYFSAARGYAASKHMGELVTVAAGREGLPVAIVRPGMIVADPRTGWCQSSDFVPRFVGGVLAVGAYPAPLPGTFEMVPVPTVAATIVRLAYEAPHDARVYHVCNPAKACLSYSEVGEAIAAAASAAAPDSDASVAVVAMDHRAWVARVREAGQATPLAPGARAQRPICGN
ncbi:fatty-acid-CoA ligase fadD9 [Thecamonas trahens ATCC 50062]|uniref:Fatty-acid-CoA ligase fadD9 n=1 Tax=Thecamonas trahens ATCC 50062 TaxID=461836 RepID=A0A0L0D6S7_THETB|nr:fatty-acid-CoA ligase fadD9 [Thecamonas trahens ATCC 50062]KNC47910.1 fatty-acid-CoA ligase fadD9 [Thecamonas trahens ATCC 50062]|eukprot:XP_013758931.1 fatty-acid-CoA ligase fadD9 [Thecamonas trahens ATCC 50062]